jgi:hypothetical protein
MTSPGLWKLHRKKPNGEGLPIGFKKGLITVIGTAPNVGQGTRYRVQCECGCQRLLLAAAIRKTKFVTHQSCKRPD